MCLFVERFQFRIVEYVILGARRCRGVGGAEELFVGLRLF